MGTELLNLSRVGTWTSDHARDFGLIVEEKGLRLLLVQNTTHKIGLNGGEMGKIRKGGKNKWGLSF